MARSGLGYLIGFLGEGGVYDAMFAVVLTVAFLGFFADRLYQRLMRRVLRMARANAGRRSCALACSRCRSLCCVAWEMLRAQRRGDALHAAAGSSVVLGADLEPTPPSGELLRRTSA